MAHDISEKRLSILTTIVLILLVVGSLAFEDWRVTTGVCLGGALSFLNLIWLKKSVASLLQKAVGDTQPPRIHSALYVLRYIIIAIIITFAVMLDVVSVAATLVGLLSFAFAILIESFIQIYFLIIDREGN